jgi:hypothetical protein
MKFVYVLEDDERFKEELFEIFKNIDASLTIRFFSDLESFHEFIIAAVKDGPRTLASSGTILKSDNSEPVFPGENHELKLIVANNDFFTTQSLSLLQKAREFFLRKKICSPEKPTSIVLTAFDNPNFDLRQSQQFGINNVIFKPLDPLIAKQHFEFALKGHQATTPETLAAIQVKASVEMLKKIDISSLSEVGFVTRNDQFIKSGSIRKYYGEIFKTNIKNSAFAFCKSSIKVNSDHYICEFSFMNLDNQQISQIRKTILKKKNRGLLEQKNLKGRKNNILIVDDDEKTMADLESLFGEKFSDVELFKYIFLPQLRVDLNRGKKKAEELQLKASTEVQADSKDIATPNLPAEADTQSTEQVPNGENAVAPEGQEGETEKTETGDQPQGDQPREEEASESDEDNEQIEQPPPEPEIQGLYDNLPPEFDMIFINYSFFDGGKKAAWDSLYGDLCSHAANFGISQARKPDIYFLSKQVLSTEELTPLTDWARDVFFTPLDKNYFFKKLVSTQKMLNTKESASIEEVKENVPFKVANPVDVTEISEGGLIMKYSRPMSLGTFREFYMLRPNAIEVPEILGTVNFTQEDESDPTITYNHFVFYGMRDVFLKHIRLWLRETYIKGKASEESE